ncbi:Hypothetical protein SRAE_1000346600 [Strongyloides ratti]|uniref:Uncharacterized protein n=1 Tax=Strongyloides ratti TaxID=34506 RepID=A0A090LAU3_STRRB|nr:Hypothetical protein SRAE_1000346600 [Strongyloides ratti]CEF65213.1 Hypothetical protein SRAE_1000346600 [Strongyloides ratti]
MTYGESLYNNDVKDFDILTRNKRQYGGWGWGRRMGMMRPWGGMGGMRGMGMYPGMGGMGMMNPMMMWG